MNPEDVDQWVKSTFPCNHLAGEDSVVDSSGWCPRCGAVCDDFVLHIKKGDFIVQGIKTKYAFVLNGRLYYYRNALVDLQLLGEGTS